MRKSLGVRELLLRDVVVGFLVVGLLHARDGADVDADIITGVDLHDDMLVVLEGGTWQDGTFKKSTCGVALGLTPHAAVIFLEHLKRGTPISLEKIFSHDLLYLMLLANTFNSMLPIASCICPMIQSRLLAAALAFLLGL